MRTTARQLAEELMKYPDAVVVLPDIHGIVDHETHVVHHEKGSPAYKAAINCGVTPNPEGGFVSIG